MSVSRFLKENARAVTHHIIADLIVLGGAGMISWYTAHRAQLQGVPDYVAILIGVGVFFVIAVAYAAIVWARTRPRDKRSNQQGTGSSSVKQDEITSLESELAKEKARAIEGAKDAKEARIVIKDLNSQKLALDSDADELQQRSGAALGFGFSGPEH